MFFMKNGSDDDYRCNGISSLDKHFEDFSVWAETTKTISSDLKTLRSTMETHVQNLSVLPNLHQATEHIVAELRLLRESLVGPATNRWSIPLAAALPVLASMGFCIVILSAILLVNHSGASSVRLTPHSLQIDGAK